MAMSKGEGGMTNFIQRLLARIFSKRIRVFGNSKFVRLDEFQMFGDKIKKQIVYELAEEMFEEGFIKLKYHRDRESMIINTKILILK